MNRSTQHAFEPEEIMAYLDGELEARQAAALASHLEHCGECQAVAAQLRQVSERLLDFQIEPCAMKLEAAAALSAKESGLASEAQETGAASNHPHIGFARKIVPQRPVGWAAAFGAVAVVLITSIIVVGRFDMPAQHSKNLAREQLAYIYEPKSGTTLFGQLPLGGQKMGGGGGGTIGGHLPGPESEEGQGAKSDSKGALIAAPEIRGPMIVQTASITIDATNYSEASGQIQPLTSARGGYVQDMTANSQTGTARSVSATLRVPDKQLESFLGDLRKLGHVEQETRNNREVTDAYVDLTARLKTARATEQRVVELLGTRTGKLSDVLEAEQELARIRGEIESMDGQRAHMEHEVRYATVQVQLNEEYREQLNPESFSTGRRLRNSLVEGLGNLAAGITGTAIFVFAYGPSILFWVGVIGIPAWFIWRRFRGTQKKDSNQAV